MVDAPVLTGDEGKLHLCYRGAGGRRGFGAAGGADGRTRAEAVVIGGARLQVGHLVAHGVVPGGQCRQRLVDYQAGEVGRRRNFHAQGDLVRGAGGRGTTGPENDAVGFGVGRGDALREGAAGGAAVATAAASPSAGGKTHGGSGHGQETAHLHKLTTVHVALALVCNENCCCCVWCAAVTIGSDSAVSACHEYDTNGEISGVDALKR